MEEIGQQIPLRPGLQSFLAIGDVGAVNCIPVNLGGRPSIVLAVKADDEEESHRRTLAASETFPLGDQVWEVTEIRRPDSPRWGATITRVR